MEAGVDPEGEAVALLLPGSFFRVRVFKSGRESFLGRTDRPTFDKLSVSSAACVFLFLLRSTISHFSLPLTRKFCALRRAKDG